MTILCKYCNTERDTCSCPKCDKCGSSNLYFHDDGREEGYPDNIECFDCGNWNQ